MLPALTTLAQVGVVIFMFTVGYEIDFASLRGRGRAVPVIALSALLVPLSLGIGCALLFRSRFAALGELATSHSFVLFIGVAVSITALPVLAALIRERDLAGTTVGVISTAAAGIMDVLAWLLLAAALVGTGHRGRFSLPVTILLITGFVVVMLAVVRPALSWWTSRSQSVLSSPVAVAFMLAMGSAWVTASLGLQPVFGGLLAGLVMRGRGAAPDADVLRSMDQAGRLLLPLFFIATGLSLDIGAVHGDALALMLLLIAISAAGKLGPAYAASRLCGLERLAVGRHRRAHQHQRADRAHRAQRRADRRPDPPAAVHYPRADGAGEHDGHGPAAGAGQTRHLGTAGHRGHGACPRGARFPRGCQLGAAAV